MKKSHSIKELITTWWNKNSDDVWYEPYMTNGDLVISCICFLFLCFIIGYEVVKNN